MKTINFSTGSKSYQLKSDSVVYVKRTAFDMDQRPESNTLYFEQIRCVGKNKNLYLVHAEDALIGESIYDKKGNYQGYRYA